MNTTVEALKDYYVEQGGQLADVVDITTIPDMIDAITALGGSGSSLPDVTAEDNGDVLTVVEGAWAKATPSGVSEIYELENMGGGVYQLKNGVLKTEIYEKLSNGNTDIIIFANNRWLRLWALQSGTYQFVGFYYDNKYYAVKADIDNVAEATVDFRAVQITN